MPKYCIEVNRSGICEENVVIHEEFESKPTKEQVVAFLESEDIGYDDNYCKFDIYEV